MSVFSRIFKGGAKELTDSIGGVLDNIITSDEEKLAAKERLTQIVNHHLVRIAEAQQGVLLAEASGSKLQRNWRPVVMLLFAFIVVYAKFIAPAFGLPNAELEPQFWTLLEIGIGGYVVGRSVEKIAGKVTQNLDLSLLKRKHRKNLEHE